MDLDAQKQAINNLPTLKETVQSAKLFTKKSLGQNFLFDLNLTDKIARSCGNLSNFTVLEVGGGPGGLTRQILTNNVNKLIVLEHDERAIPIQQELANIVGDRIFIKNTDALKTDLNDLITEANGTVPIKIIANLPYNIGTELLFEWLDNIELIDSMTLMFQKEVAQRIAAKPNTKHYGIISVLTQFYCDCDVLFDINPAAFFPPPKVTSSVIFIKNRNKKIANVDFNKLKHVVKTLFQQRRKTLGKSTKNLTKDSLQLLEKAGINPKLRPENLSISDFCAITIALN